MAERVTRVLRKRGAPTATIDDALQTAALRALTRHGGFDSLEGLTNWVIVVAWHEVQAEWRSQARVRVGDIPEYAAGPDPCEVVEDRLTLEAVTAAFALLKADDQDSILSALIDSPRPNKPQEPQVKMRRHRARQRLAAKAQRLGGGGTRS